MTNEQNIRAILECFFSGYKDEIIDSATKRILDTIEAEPEHDEWCTDCKEYDQKRHCCPRFRRVIRETVEDVRQNAQTEVVRCKDCVRWNTIFDRTKAEYGLCQIRSQLEATKNDDFCSRGERRTDELGITN